MYKQHNIHQRLTSAEGLARVRRVLKEDGLPTRAAVARQICSEFGFCDARGKPQIASCLQTLLYLEREQLIALPLPSLKNVGAKRGARRLPEPVPAAVAVPDRVDRVQGFELVLVESNEQRWLWNELMASEHPRGAVIHVGCQLRYLVHSAHGYLGAVGFAASALRLKCREEWIGWSEELRREQLYRVVNMNRFLIREDVRCLNLASKALGGVLRRLPADFEARYGYRPYLVESFVGPDYSGVSLRAANWRHVGETAGRGRFAKSGTRVSVKSVYVYELQQNWRQQLGVKPHPVATREVAAGLDSERWPEQEFGGAPLGNKRLSERLVKIVTTQAKRPTASFATAIGADQAALQGLHRLMGKPDDSPVTSENILAVHRQRTLERMQSQCEVLCVQGGTDLNYADRGEGAGMGAIGKNRSSKGALRLHLHSLLALDVQGVPLGVLNLEFSDNEAAGEKTQRWLRGFEVCVEMARQLEEVRVVSVMDREADFLELFTQPGVGRQVHLLVRAKHSRSLVKDEEKLFEKVQSAPLRAVLKMTVKRRSQKAQSKQQERVTQLELRWCSLQLPAPSKKQFKGRPPVSVQVVSVQERKAPAGIKPLQCTLLTTLPVNSRQDAEQVLARYHPRQRIEDWHRALKSGCKAELQAYQSLGRMRRVITINAVIAWRLAVMTLLGRETPELPMPLAFSDLEIACLQDSAE